MNNVLVLRDIQKSFRQRKVLKSISLDIGVGEIVGLLGPNGAGKSTAFNVIAGLLKPDQGSIELLGTEVAGAPLNKRAALGLGYLAQEPTVFRHLSALDNLAAVLQLQGATRSQSKEGAHNLLDRYGLLHLAQSYGYQLSGGERRRLEMIRALIPQPKIMLLDEPFAGVDPIAIKELRSHLVAIKNEGISILLTDHNVREALKICDRAYLIADGTIFAAGAPSSIASNEEARAMYLGDDFTL